MIDSSSSPRSDAFRIMRATRRSSTVRAMEKTRTRGAARDSSAHGRNTSSKLALLSGADASVSPAEDEAAQRRLARVERVCTDDVDGFAAAIRSQASSQRAAINILPTTV